MAEIKTLIGSVPVNRGEWSSGTTYYLDNIVQSGDSSYICIAESTTAAVTVTSAWKLLAKGCAEAIVQTTGSSTTSVMSQKAVTDLTDTMQGYIAQLREESPTHNVINFHKLYFDTKPVTEWTSATNPFARRFTLADMLGVIDNNSESWASRIRTGIVFEALGEDDRWHSWRYLGASHNEGQISSVDKWKETHSYLQSQIDALGSRADSTDRDMNGLQDQIDELRDTNLVDMNEDIDLNASRINTLEKETTPRNRINFHEFIHATKTYWNDEQNPRNKAYSLAAMCEELGAQTVGYAKILHGTVFDVCSAKPGTWRSWRYIGASGNQDEIISTAKWVEAGTYTVEQGVAQAQADITSLQGRMTTAEGNITTAQQGVYELKQKRVSEANSLDFHRFLFHQGGGEDNIGWGSKPGLPNPFDINVTTKTALTNVLDAFSGYIDFSRITRGLVFAVRSSSSPETWTQYRYLGANGDADSAKNPDNWEEVHADINNRLSEPNVLDLGTFLFHQGGGDDTTGWPSGSSLSDPRNALCANAATLVLRLNQYVSDWTRIRPGLIFSVRVDGTTYKQYRYKGFYSTAEAVKDASNWEEVGASEREAISDLSEQTPRNTHDIDALMGMRDDSELPTICGQPTVLFGAGAPVEANVPYNWRQFDPEGNPNGSVEDGTAATGYNWNGTPAGLGQQYYDVSETVAVHYIAARQSFDPASADYHTFIWKQC